MYLALTPIVDQLKQGGYTNAEGLIEFADLANVPARLPALFVIPLTEDAEPNRLDGARDQRVVTGVSMMIVIDASRRHTAGIAEDVKTETDKVKQLITGWRHPDAARPFDYRGGRLVSRLGSANGSAIVWELRFTSTYHLRKKS